MDACSQAKHAEDKKKKAKTDADKTCFDGLVIMCARNAAIAAEGDALLLANANGGPDDQGDADDGQTDSRYGQPNAHANASVNAPCEALGCRVDPAAVTLTEPGCAYDFFCSGVA